MGANVISLVVHQLLSAEAQRAWGWRIPFLMAIPLGVVSIIMRRCMHETEDFKVLQQQRKDVAVVARPEASLEEQVGSEESSDDGARADTHWLSHLRATAIIVVVIAAANSCNYMPIYLARWLQKRCHFKQTLALGLSGVAKVVQALVTLPVSFVGDRIGTTCTMLLGGVASAVTILPSFLLVLWLSDNGSNNLPLSIGGEADDTMPEPSTLLVTTAFLLLGVFLPVLAGFYNIPCTAFMTSLFPPAVRGRGAGLALGLASLAGGFTPMICSVLANELPWLPGLFVTLLTVPSLTMLVYTRWAAAKGQVIVHQRPWLF